MKILDVVFKYDLDRSTKHPTLNPTRVQTNDFQIMKSTFHAPRQHTAIRNHGNFVLNDRTFIATAL